MKIAISGASGTGKTTLARALSEHYKIPLNPIGARDVAKAMGFDNPYDVDKAGKRVEFQARLFEAKLEWEQAHDNFVTDRSYLDNLTYCCLHILDQVTEDMVSRFRTATLRYDAVFVLPRGVFQNLDDGIRQTNPVYHELYDVILKHLYDSSSQYAFGNNTLVIRLGCALNDRFSLVRDHVQMLGLTKGSISR